MFHVPPYPMKIAPAEGREDRPTRTETCMFMIKYSSEQVMKERVLQAINCRDDPLSGYTRRDMCFCILYSLLLFPKDCQTEQK